MKHSIGWFDGEYYAPDKKLTYRNAQAGDVDIYGDAVPTNYTVIVRKADCINGRYTCIDQDSKQYGWTIIDPSQAEDYIPTAHTHTHASYALPKKARKGHTIKGEYYPVCYLIVAYVVLDGIVRVATQHITPEHYARFMERYNARMERKAQSS